MIQTVGNAMTWAVGRNEAPFEDALGEATQAESDRETQPSSGDSAGPGLTTIDLAREMLFRHPGDQADRARFAIRELLGEGSFGRVYLAFDHDIGREVAVKVFKALETVGEGDVAREVQIAGQIDHPGVPAIYDVGRGDDGNAYCVMKRLHAIELEEIINGLKACDPEMHAKYPFHRRCQLGVGLLRILVTAHARGIVHRDIKPQNILVGTSGEVMLIDWGIAVDLSKGDGSERVAGTPCYMAPEQVRGEALDARTDLFAVGAVLYEFMSLELACPDEEDIVALLQAISTHKPPPLHLMHHPVQGGVPAEYVGIVHRALARKPDDRFASAADMLNALENAAAGVFDVSCSITQIKAPMHRVMRWIDANPIRNTVLFWTYALGAMLLLASGGFALCMALGIQ